MIYMHIYEPCQCTLCGQKIRNTYQAYDHLRKRHNDVLMADEKFRDQLIERLPMDTEYSDTEFDVIPRKRGRPVADTNSLAFILQNKAADDKEILMKVN